MAYFEGEIPTVVSGNNSNGFGNGFSDGWWGIILIALLFGWGRGGYGFGGGNGGNGEVVGYELGKMATQADIATGFNNSAVLGSLNDLKLGQAGIQQTLCEELCVCCYKHLLDSVYNLNRYESFQGMTIVC